MRKSPSITKKFCMGKRLSFLLAAVLAELPLVFAQSHIVPFSITITSDTNIFKVGSEVRIRLVFKNTSAQDIPYVRKPGTGIETQGEFFSDIEVRDAKGELAPDTKYHQLIRGKHDISPTPSARKKTGAALPSSDIPEPLPRIGGSFMTIMLKPGESREEDIVVSKLYDLSKPGQYTISASRRLSDVLTDPNSKLVGKSNTLMITITE
jgi:hypothetical protein